MIEAVIEKWHQHMRGQLPGGLDELLDDDCVFLSPIVYTPQEGKAITKMYLEAAGQTLPGDPASSGGSGATGGSGGGFRYTKEVLAGDTAVLTGRSLRHILRSPDTIITTAVTPVAIMILFVFVFGGAIDTGSSSYIDYMLPGILLITIASGIAYTAYRLFLDLQGGIFQRFQSMPTARSSALWAHVLTSLVANLISVNRRHHTHAGIRITGL